MSNVICKALLIVIMLAGAGDSPAQRLTMRLIPNVDTQFVKRVYLVDSLADKIQGGDDFFAGLSGIDVNGSTMYLIPDKSNGVAGCEARFYSVNFQYDTGTITFRNFQEVVLTNQQACTNAESIRIDAASGRLYWLSEGDNQNEPFIKIAALDGRADSRIDFKGYSNANSGATKFKYNAGPEGLSIYNNEI